MTGDNKPELLEDADRSRVFYLNGGHNPRQFQFIKPKVHKGATCFGGQSSSPKLTREIEAQDSLAGNRRPILDMWIQATAPHVAVIHFQHTRPHRHTTINGMHSSLSESLLRHLSRSGIPTNIPAHLGIGLHRAERIKVGRLMGTKQQPL